MFAVVAVARVDTTLEGEYPGASCDSQPNHPRFDPSLNKETRRRRKNMSFDVKNCCVC